MAQSLGHWEGDHMPDGAYQVALGVNRVLREAVHRNLAAVDRVALHELTIRFTMEGVVGQIVDVRSIDLIVHGDQPAQDDLVDVDRPPFD